ncbi:MAG: hypothetical protein MUP04_04125, partial [Anaerolineae bacterium]|nr:hypothetical protein [Anaerolineae bacterium]
MVLVVLLLLAGLVLATAAYVKEIEGRGTLWGRGAGVAVLRGDGDVTIEGLFAEGYQAIFLATGAHESWRLNLEGEDVEGVYPSMQFLKAFNLRG